MVELFCRALIVEEAAAAELAQLGADCQLSPPRKPNQPTLLKEMKGWLRPRLPPQALESVKRGDHESLMLRWVVPSPVGNSLPPEPLPFSVM